MDAFLKDPIKATQRKGQGPTYDNRQGYSCGSDYGRGFNQPVGTEKQSSKSAIPMGCKRFSAEDLIKNEKKG